MTNDQFTIPLSVTSQITHPLSSNFIACYHYFSTFLIHVKSDHKMESCKGSGETPKLIVCSPSALIIYTISSRSIIITRSIKILFACIRVKFDTLSNLIFWEDVNTCLDRPKHEHWAIARQRLAIQDILLATNWDALDLQKLLGLDTYILAPFSMNEYVVYWPDLLKMAAWEHNVNTEINTLFSVRNPTKCS